jgi:hypothetical protein
LRTLCRTSSLVHMPTPLTSIAPESHGGQDKSSPYRYLSVPHHRCGTLGSRRGRYTLFQAAANTHFADKQVFIPDDPTYSFPTILPRFFAERRKGVFFLKASP